MNIRSTYEEDLSELLSFYNRMCNVLGEQDFLPEGDKGGFPSEEMGQKAIRLDCIEGNDIPQKMYQSLGFQYIDSVRIIYPDIGVPKRFHLYEILL